MAVLQKGIQSGKNVWVVMLEPRFTSTPFGAKHLGGGITLFRPFYTKINNQNTKIVVCLAFQFLFIV